MNTYLVSIEAEEKPNSMSLAVAAVERRRVVALRYVEDILGDEYHRITCGVDQFSEDVLDALCFHTKTKQVCYELAQDADNADVSFGVLADGKFVEL
ncbi:Uncharacterised protein [Oligella ureolytica]|uniref:Uncharacterized protein n=1 Tax=Oligella ureolytica TaxID=90244 RepID=A0A378XDA0_9BURK|nr:hypothetical protein [Oligella ureolytica]NLP31557.1 hypothetical protein [Oligella ureolytica]QPT40881.1 hypothetical protein I6G29_04780 [Oligella ureolytica]SUA53033.1 Uncharacterised protein [Oligella ureolytica]SUA57747.1 Uncharacterised protein [Oligella ureolytica]